MEKKKMKDIVMYGIGGVGEDISYNLFYMFFIFFLTSVVGMNPALAGTISLIAVAWDGVSDPIIGYLSDHCKGWRGFSKRGLFILIGVVPLGVSVFLLFNNVSFASETHKFIYFIVINIFFWLFFTVVDIPYVAAATEITDDYDVKTKLRTSVMLFSNLGQMVLAFGVLNFIEYMEVNGYSDSLAWRIVGAVLGFISTLAFLIVALSLRNKEITKTPNNEAKLEDDGQSNKSLLQDLRDFLKMRDYVSLMLIALVFNIFLGIVNSSMVQYMLYSLEMTKSQTATISTIALIASLVLIVPIGELIVKFGKKQIMLVCFAYLAIFSAICGFCTPNKILMIILMLLLYASSSVFWINIYAMNYDVCTVYEFKYKKNREGLMISITSFMTKVGIAIGMWLNGTLMAKMGVDPTAEVITQQMSDGMRMIFGKVPAIVAIILVVICLTYRIKKSHILAIEEAANLEKEGKPFSTEGFKEIL